MNAANKVVSVKPGTQSGAVGGRSYRTIMPNARVTPRFAGVCTFCRFPTLEAAASVEYSGGRPVDWVVYGVPFDAGVTFRPGSRFGPRAIRDASQYVKPYSIEHELNVCEVLSIADGGDAPISPFALKQTLDGVLRLDHGDGPRPRGP